MIVFDNYVMYVCILNAVNVVFYVKYVNLAKYLICVQFF